MALIERLPGAKHCSGCFACVIHWLNPPTALWRKNYFYHPILQIRKSQLSHPLMCGVAGFTLGHLVISPTGNLISLYGVRVVAPDLQMRKLTVTGTVWLKSERWKWQDTNSNLLLFILPKNDDLRHFKPEPEELSPNQFSKSTNSKSRRVSNVLICVTSPAALPVIKGR